MTRKIELCPPLHSDHEAEQAVLGAILLRPEALADVMTILKPEYFYHEKHRIIYKALIEMDLSQKPIDLVTVTGFLLDRGQLFQVGGPAYLASLNENVGTAINITYYARRVREKAGLRKIREFSQELNASLKTQLEDPIEIQDWIEARLFEIGQELRLELTSEHISTMVESEAELLSQIHQNKTQVGLKTGYPDLDRLISWRPEQVSILAGRTSMGKTNLALNFMLKAAHDGASVGFYSLEMSNSEISRRVFAIEGEIEAYRLSQVWLKRNDWLKINQAVRSLKKLDITMDFSRSLSIMDIRSKARRAKLHGKLDLLVVDYLQLVKPFRKARSREEEVAETSRGLKSLARELKIPILVVAQLNRKCEDRPDKRPKLSDLRESGAIEQDADVVILIYRDKDQDINCSNNGLMEVNVAKNRNGRTGLVKLAYQESFLKFGNYQTAP